MTPRDELHALVDQLDGPETTEVLDFTRWLVLERTGPVPELLDGPLPLRWGRA